MLAFCEKFPRYLHKRFQWCLWTLIFWTDGRVVGGMDRFNTYAISPNSVDYIDGNDLMTTLSYYLVSEAQL